MAAISLQDSSASWRATVTIKDRIQKVFEGQQYNPESVMLYDG